MLAPGCAGALQLDGPPQLLSSGAVTGDMRRGGEGCSRVRGSREEASMAELS